MLKKYASNGDTIRGNTEQRGEFFFVLPTVIVLDNILTIFFVILIHNRTSSLGE